MIKNWNFKELQSIKFKIH